MKRMIRTIHAGGERLELATFPLWVALPTPSEFLCSLL
jgi:hypothetical protein